MNKSSLIEEPRFGQGDFYCSRPTLVGRQGTGWACFGACYRLRTVLCWLPFAPYCSRDPGERNPSNKSPSLEKAKLAKLVYCLEAGASPGLAGPLGMALRHGTGCTSFWFRLELWRFPESEHFWRCQCFFNFAHFSAKATPGLARCTVDCCGRFGAPAACRAFRTGHIFAS